MKNLMRRTTFYFYYRVTEYGFYNDAEKKRILRLIALANGHEEGEIDALFNTVMRLEADRINDPINCKNYLLVANFIQDTPKDELEAVEALNEFYVKNNRSKLYSGRSSWCRAMIKCSNHLERGFFEYASDRLQNAIVHFESAINGEDEDWPLPELTAITAIEAGDYKKAFRYAIEAQWVDGSTKVDIPWMSCIEESSRRALDIDDSKEIESRVHSRSNCSYKIGFLA